MLDQLSSTRSFFANAGKVFVVLAASFAMGAAAFGQAQEPDTPGVEASGEDRFLRGGWKVFWSEEAIITHALPPSFKARFRLASIDRAPDPNRRVTVIDHVGGDQIRFARGADVALDAQSLVLRVNLKDFDVDGRWFVQQEVGSPIPHETLESLLMPGHPASTLLYLDEPRYITIHYDASNFPSTCQSMPIDFRIDGSKPTDENGSEQPTYPGTTILTYGRRVDVLILSACPTAKPTDRFKITIAYANPADVERTLGIETAP